MLFRAKRGTYVTLRRKKLKILHFILNDGLAFETASF